MSQTITVSSPRQAARNKIIPDQVFAMIVLVFTEVMFFMALISAFVVIKSSRASWSLPEGVALPVAMTGFNTLVLFASGVMLWYCGRLVQDNRPHAKARAALALAMGLGAFFVMVQGYEWAQLISYGLTMRSSIFGACFFLLVGSHALHALAGILAMVYLFAKSRSALRLADCRALQIFWFFVVGIWPLLYYLVYFEAVR